MNQRKHARRFVEQELGHLLPGAVDERGFRWDLLTSSRSRGTDRFRLRPDESGYTNLFLAGD